MTFALAEDGGSTPAPQVHDLLAVVGTGASHVPGGPRLLRRYGVAAEGRSVHDGQHFAHCSIGLFDGFRFDVDGNLWAGTGDGVHCLAPDELSTGDTRLTAKSAEQVSCFAINKNCRNAPLIHLLRNG